MSVTLWFLLLFVMIIDVIATQPAHPNFIYSNGPLSVSSGWIKLPEHKTLIVWGMIPTILHSTKCGNIESIDSNIIHKIRMYDDTELCVIFRPGFIEYLLSESSTKYDHILYTHAKFIYAVRIAEYISDLIFKMDPSKSFRFNMILSTQDYVRAQPHEFKYIGKGLDPIFWYVFSTFGQLTKPIESREYFYTKVIIMDAHPKGWSPIGIGNTRYAKEFQKNGEILMPPLPQFRVWESNDLNSVKNAKEEMDNAIKKCTEMEKVYKAFSKDIR